MRRLSIPLTSILIASLIYPTAAGAQVKALQNTGGISMESVQDLGQQGVGPKLQGGREARTEDWPASFYSSADGARCTATLLGPRALLLAAHCVANGGLAAIRYRNTQYSGPCTHADGYNDGAGDPSADYALCRLSVAVPGVMYETVNLNPARIQRGTDLLLTGYGCTQRPPPGSSTPSGGNDGKYRIGEAPVVALPGERANEINSILTRDETAVCPGDSGGGAFRVTAQGRLLVGVNSRIDYANYESYLSSTSTPAARTFFNKWLANNANEQICGINLNDGTCR